MSTSLPTGTPPSVPTPSSPLPYWQPSPPPRKPRTRWIIALVAGILIVPLVACAIAAAVIGGFATYWATHQNAVTATSNQTFTVTGVPSVTIHDPAGVVTIVTTDTGQVVVQATKRASDPSKDQAQHVLSTMSVSSTQSGGAVNIEGSLDSAHPLTQQRIDLQVTVPQHSNLDVTVAAGTLNITGVSGVIHVKVSAGNATLRDTAASGTSTISVPVGNLRYDGSLADSAAMDVTVGTGNADILLPQDSATHVEASVGVGNITVTGWPATIQRQGTGATTNIYLKLAPRNTLTVHVGTGNMTLSPRS